MEAIKGILKTWYIMLAGVALYMLAQQVGLFNAIAGILAIFIMAE